MTSTKTKEIKYIFWNTEESYKNLSSVPNQCVNLQWNCMCLLTFRQKKKKSFVSLWENNFINFPRSFPEIAINCFTRYIL